MLDVMDDHVGKHPRPLIFLDFIVEFALESFDFGNQMLLLDAVVDRIHFARIIAIFDALVAARVL